MEPLAGLHSRHRLTMPHAVFAPVSALGGYGAVTNSVRYADETWISGRGA